MQRRWQHIVLAGMAALVAACQDAPTTPVAVTATPEPARAQVHTGEGYRAKGERRTGWITGRDGNPVQVRYEVQGEWAIWDGDIIIGKAREVPTTREALLRQSRFGSFQAIYINGSGFRWTGGVVPYVIDAGLPSQSRMTTAMSDIAAATAGITFVLRTSETDYIHFQDDTGCSSAIGRQGGEQVINFGSGCSTGNARHEILHALGLYHEQSRCDRDDFVEVHLDQVESGKEHNFDKVCSGATDHGEYNEGSIMHYGPNFFAIGSLPTLTSKRGRDAEMGQRAALASTDIATLNLLYGANNQPPTAVIQPLAASYNEGASIAFNGAGSSDPDDVVLTYAWDFGDGATSTDQNPSHTYADDGDYTVSLTVSDGTLNDTESTTAHVVNVAPTVNAGADGQENEGALFTQGGSFTDPGADSWSATVDYGDGSGVQALTLSGKNFTLSHTYIDNGIYTITVTVTDDEGGTGMDQVGMTILNVVPTVNAGPDGTVTSGENFTLTGGFSDPGIIDYPWNWSINWGFGANSTGSTNDQSAAIEATTRACAAGTYNVVLSVTDKDNGTGNDNMQLTVSYLTVPIDITPTATPNPVNLTKGGLLPVALLSTATFDATAANPATITLGNEVGMDTPVAKQNKGTYHAKFQDVNKDGRLDLVLMFDNKALVANGDITMATTSLVLRGFMSDGCTNFRGSDVVVVVP